MNALTIEADVADRDIEQLVLCRDPAAGLRSVIAIHDTTLGPALGGVRMRRYDSHDAAIRDAIDLAEAMTYKAALAGLALGGGKSVIDADPRAPGRTAMLTAHARYIGALGGRYIPGVDMGTTVEDLDLMARHVPVVSSQRRDPSRYTALGVLRSIEAALDWAGGPTAGLDGRRVAVQGLGHVGRHLVEMLRAAGAEVLVADLDDKRVATVRDRFGAVPVAVDAILGADVDVLCPCAAGGVITEPVVDGLKARMVIAAANNVLADDRIATALAARGIVYVPDFVANAGGLIACEAEVRGTDDGLDARVDAIGDTARAVLGRATETGTDVVTVAVGLARDRLAARRHARPHFPAA